MQQDPSSPNPAAAPQRHRLAIPESLAGERLDRALAALLPGHSRSRLKALIEAGAVAAEAGATLVEPSRKVKTGEVLLVDVPAPQPAVPQAQAIALRILHEDSELIVLDKPAGLVVHPAPGNPDRTLVNALLAHCGASLSGIGGVRRPGIVHRLDKDTSGVMVAAKTDRAHHALSQQFAAHSIERAYLAVTAGAPKPPQGEIAGNIGRSPRDRKRMAVLDRGGRAATTRYRVVRSFGPALAPLAALVECQLLTGRTHQVRVHLAHLGNPLIGDPVYFRARATGMRAGLAALGRALGRQALHAARLGFDHPGTGRRVRFESELPADIKELLQNLEAEALTGTPAAGRGFSNNREG